MKWKVTLFVIVLLLLAACNEEPAPAPAGETAEITDAASATPAPPTARAGSTATATPSPIPSNTPTPTLTPTPTRVPTGPVAVCLGEEPPSLYLYGPDSAAAATVREAIYDGPVDTRSFDVQPVILEAIPSLENGGATLETVPVREGEWVVDVEGNLARLRPGLTVYPAGCREEACAVTWSPDRGPTPTVVPPGEPTPTRPPTATPAVVLEMERLVVEFTLLPGLTWSDGEPLTAADSVFSYQVAREAQLPPRLRTGSQGVLPERTIDPVPRTSEYSAVDERTVRWVGVPGFLDQYYRSNFFIPLPEHQLGAYTPAELLSLEEAARTPLGWGPYQIAEWVPGERIVAERNPHYFRAGEDLPYFDRVIFRFLDRDADVVAELAEGGCDVVAGDLLQPAAYGDYLAAAEGGDLAVHAVPGTIWEHLDFGINPVPNYDWRGDFFQDPRVRQAAAYCLDRQALVAETMAGLSTPLNAYIHPQHPLYAEGAPEAYAYDPQRGVELLNEAGWRDTNGDGVAEAYGVGGVANGTVLAFNYDLPDNLFRQQVAERVRADLGACGFRVFPSTLVAPPEFYSSDGDSPVFSRRFDLTNFAWLADARPPCHLYHSAQIPTVLNGWRGFNVSGYQNEAYDAACTAGQAAVPGTDAYRQNHLEALRIFNAELPAIPLFLHAQVALARPDLQGFSLDPTEPAETWNVEAWALAEE